MNVPLFALLCSFAGFFAGAEIMFAQGSEKSKMTSGQTMNPDTSVNVLTKYQDTTRKGETSPDPENGFSLQEVEVQFLADVDAYFRASVLLAVAPAATDPTAPTAETEYHIEPEEVFVESISLPYVTLKAGKFKAALGRHNGLHTHAYPFIDAPLINQELLGDEGFGDNGISAAALLPIPWFSELTLQGFQGRSPELFGSKTPNDIAKVARWRNLFEVSDALTVDFGLSGARGENINGGTTTVTGQDISIKWRPTEGGKYTSVTFATEALQGKLENREEGEELSGFASWVQYQFLERWWLQARGEQARIPHLKDETDPTAGTEEETWNKVSAVVGFVPSEFSAFRLQWDQLRDDQDEPLNRVALQMNITIGAHPAHSY